MQVKLPRRRWLLLLLVAIAGLASWSLWPRSVMRERYEQIRIGMTRAEVALSMGSSPSREALMRQILDPGTWDPAAQEGQRFDFAQIDSIEPEAWVDESVAVSVYFSHGRAVLKAMEIRVPAWKMKARDWLNWLRGLVGW